MHAFWWDALAQASDASGTSTISDVLPQSVVGDIRQQYSAGLAGHLSRLCVDPVTLQRHSLQH